MSSDEAGKDWRDEGGDLERLSRPCYGWSFKDHLRKDQHKDFCFQAWRMLVEPFALEQRCS